MNYFSRSIFLMVVVLFLVFFYSCHTAKTLATYQGTSYSDAVYQHSGGQTIPGKLQCEYYDQGGEGIAYHDTDSINSGSGHLNPADGSYLHEFRIHEPVDISYTKSRGIDDNEYNLVEPEMDQLYVGWTNPGEWIKYTINVKTTGRYRIGIMYTAHEHGQISLSINDQDLTGPLNIESTFVEADTVAWRQWHHWNYIDQLTEINLKRGVQTLTLHTVASGQMNYDYLDFSLIP